MSSTPFQIVSDLHLETQAAGETFMLKQTAPNLALLGDIGQVADVDGRLFVFLEQQLRRYWNVFFLLMERLRAISTVGRFVLLDQTRHDVNDRLTVLGCTLLSSVVAEQRDAVGGRLIDFRQIRDWDVDGHNDAHDADVGWLNAQVVAIGRAEPQRRIAIFTHHSPTVDARAADRRHRGSPVASGFATDLHRQTCWTSPAVVLWAFGHTHWSCDFVDEAAGTRAVANQRGYAQTPSAGFDAKKIVFVGDEVRTKEESRTERGLGEGAIWKCLHLRRARISDTDEM